MSVLDDYKDYTFAPGFISSEKKINGNVVGWTGYAFCQIALSGGQVDPNRILDLQRSVEVRLGLLTRYPGYTDFTPAEDYYGWCAGAYLNGAIICIRFIKDYWDAHWGIFNSRQPGCPVLWDRVFTSRPWTAGAPIFARFPALYTHLTYCCDQSPSEGYRKAWRAALAGDPIKKSQDALMQNWAMIKAYDNSSYGDTNSSLAIFEWWRVLKNAGLSMRQIAEEYTQNPTHPVVMNFEGL